MGEELLRGIGNTLAILLGLGLTFGAFVGFAVLLIRRGDTYRYGARGVPATDRFDQVAAAFAAPAAERGEQDSAGDRGAA